MKRGCARCRSLSSTPAKPICDPHHHLLGSNGYRYLLHELLADLCLGHRIVSTVHIECDSMFRAEGPRGPQFRWEKRNL